MVQQYCCMFFPVYRGYLGTLVCLKNNNMVPFVYLSESYLVTGNQFFLFPVIQSVFITLIISML